MLLVVYNLLFVDNCLLCIVSCFYVEQCRVLFCCVSFAVVVFACELKVLRVAI